MAEVTLTIDNEKVSAREGQNLLQVIREQGIDLPTLCHLDGLSERGGCRLCVVEVEGSSRLAASCVTAVREDMRVTTASDRLLRYRRMLVELLFAERNHVCSVCVMNGNCELQSLATRFGVDHLRYEPLYPRLPTDASHEKYTIDHNRCVLCARCVRVCDEVEGVHTLDIMGRGVSSRIINDLNQPWRASRTCTACGKCVQVCPTGALYIKETLSAHVEKRPDLPRRIVDARKKRVWNS